jgi:hypothetical protein
MNLVVLQEAIVNEADKSGSWTAIVIFFGILGFIFWLIYRSLEHSGYYDYQHKPRNYSPGWGDDDNYHSHTANHSSDTEKREYHSTYGSGSDTSVYNNIDKAPPAPNPNRDRLT